jgi:ATP-binding cassette, subfamily B, bacterial MsbA
MKDSSGDKNQWKTYGRLLQYARPYSMRLMAALVCGALFAGSNAGLVWLIRNGFKKIFSMSIEMNAAILLAVLFPLAGLVRGLADFASRYLIRWVGNRTVMDIRNASFRHILRLSVAFFSNKRTGELISRVTNDTLLIESAVSNVVADVIKEPFSLIAMAGWLVYLDPKLSLISVVLIPVCIIPLRLFGKRIRQYARQGQERVADLMSILQEAITGIRIVKAFGMENYECERFEHQNRVFFGRVMRGVRTKASTEPLIVILACTAIAAVLVYASWTGMKVEDFAAYAVALFMMYEPVKKLGNVHLQIQESSAAADRIFDLLDTPITVTNRPGAVPFHGEVQTLTFDHVGFEYPGVPVLKDISFSVAAGTRVAVVGGSGAGKTTLVNLVPRFADVSAGRVLVNGTDIRDFTIESLRKHIGMVTQETILFNDTVARNIAYGTSDASLDAVKAAAERAHAHAFISKMPLGYDTVIGEHGVRLSGGQRQRLAIARAILRNPPILILDEATSALDAQSERIVQVALEELITGRTVLVISHRLSTIINADRILVLAHGRVAEQGKHEELLALGGVYKSLYDLQSRDAAGPQSRDSHGNG